MNSVGWGRGACVVCCQTPGLVTPPLCARDGKHD